MLYCTIRLTGEAFAIFGSLASFFLPPPSSPLFCHKWKRAFLLGEIAVRMLFESMRDESFRGPSPLRRVINMGNKLSLKVIETECEWIQNTTLSLLDETNRNTKGEEKGATQDQDQCLKDKGVRFLRGLWLLMQGRQATPNPFSGGTDASLRWAQLPYDQAAALPEPSSVTTSISGLLLPLSHPWDTKRRRDGMSQWCRMALNIHWAQGNTSTSYVIHESIEWGSKTG